MKALLALTLISIFMTQAQAVEDIELKIVSKECLGVPMPLDAKERIRFMNGMMAKFSPAVSDGSKTCNSVVAGFIASSSFVKTNDMSEESGMVVQAIKREVCRDINTQTVLSDEQSAPAQPNFEVKISINSKEKSGTVVIQNAFECPRGELVLKLGE